MPPSRIRWILPLLASLLCAPTLMADEREVTLSLPPASIGQWYPPANRHQVWLHTMFRLRRAMQAVTEYAALGETALMQKWLERLAVDYLKIGEMVPEWKDELEVDLLAKMKTVAAAGKAEEVQRLQRKLGKSCQSCHREYRTVTALLYRAPDFREVRVEDSETLEEEPYGRVMERLSMLLNRVKIASEDGRREAAATATEELQRRLEDLGTSCEACHQDASPRRRILGAALQAHFKSLTEGIERGDGKGVNRTLGEFAVETCARCHGIHRLSAKMRRLLTPKKRR